MTEAFISYSRKDKEFVKKLYDALKEQKREVWVDWKGIPSTAEWRKEIYEAIEATDNFIFIISPNSVASKICGEELGHALKHNKRLVPIVWQDADNVDDQLAKIQYIFFQESNDFNTALRSLLEALDTDLEHVKEHTRLLMLALEWEEKKRNSSYLLQGSQLEEAEQWLTKGTGKNPLPTTLQQDYIGESRKAQRARYKTKLIGLTTAFVISAGSAIIAVIGWKEADRQRITAAKSELQALISASDAGFTANRDTIDALIAGLKAAKKLKELEKDKITIPPDDRAKVMTVLGQAIYWVRERNSLNDSDAIRSVSFSPDGEILATGGANRMVKLWNKHGRLLHTLEGHQDNVMSVSFSADSQILASASLDGTVKLWNRQGQLFQTFDIKTGVRAVSFSPDGKTLASGSEDNSVRLWNRERQQPQILNRHTDEINTYQVNSVSFSPDSQMIAIAVGNSVKLRQLDGGEISLNGHNAAISQVAFSRDGQTIATASDDKTVKLWHKDGTEITTLTGHDGEVNSISFSPDNKSLISGSKDGTAILWNIENLTLDGLTARGCDWLHDYLTNNTNAQGYASEDHLCDRVRTQTGS
ncbi:MAG: TIR domain-containing protein [Nostoc sp. ChiSLP02]|nr:TIR domain-containing protein [Nostoc sp. DedSLP05]MDZ8098627.1 TIR domain-containing protein [Nostoc sp. DedSLP01]MDZ8183761.1 TIR domain-containing protein [Nostoc sp. ChiSLP02]